MNGGSDTVEVSRIDRANSHDNKALVSGPWKMGV